MHHHLPPLTRPLVHVVSDRGAAYRRSIPLGAMNHPKNKNRIALRLCFAIALLFLIGCNGPKRAYYHYQVDALEPHLFVMGDSLPGMPRGLHCCDAIKREQQVGILLQPRVHFYYKTKERNYSPAQRGSKCSEEKIAALDLFLVQGSDTVHLENAVSRYKPFSTDRITITALNVAISSADERRIFTLPEFIAAFNECGTAFAADHAVAHSYLFHLDTAALPSGKHVLICRVRLDTGREVVSRVDVALK
jgi:hypothetical protein